MSLRDVLSRLLGGRPVSISTLNERSTARPAPAPSPAVALPTRPSSGIDVPPEYIRIREFIEARTPIVFVSGKAGTGKSTLIHYLYESLKGRNIVKVAPTGIAALNVGGATIHSFFRLPPRTVLPEDIKELTDRRLYRAMDLLIVDEVSMVRADLVDAIDAFMRLNGRDADAPFGGVQIVFVGDLFQLPPVVNHEDRTILRARGYRSPYFFSAHALQSLQLVPVELRKLYRQRDPLFAGLLDSIRIAEDVEPTVESLNQACAVDADARPTLITLCATNAKADAINRHELRRLPAASRQFAGEVTAKFRTEESNLPAPMNLELKVGARVMFTANGPFRQWVNGTLGTVERIDDRSVRVRITDSSSGAGRTVDVERNTWESFRFVFDRPSGKIRVEVTGSFRQFPLMLAWATTIHKSQGKTLDSVSVDLGHGAFATGQVYVALSRCRSIEGLRLARPIREEEVKCDPVVRDFFVAMAGSGERV